MTAVRHKLAILYNPHHRSVNTWTDDEDDELMRSVQIGDGVDGKMLKTLISRLVAMHGRDWSKIGNLMERPGGLCFFRFREYTSKKEYRVSGKRELPLEEEYMLMHPIATIGLWTPEEDSKLMAAVEEVSRIGSLRFTAVAAKMGETRSPTICRLRWCLFLRPASSRLT
jgi:hypothetical protein